MKINGLKPVVPPRSVYKYFKAEYFKYKSKFTDQMKTNCDATDMWTKLNFDEREKFRARFEASKCQHEKEYARYLSKLEPYLKKKKRCSSEKSFIEDATIHDAVDTTARVDDVRASSDLAGGTRVDINNKHNDGSQCASVSPHLDDASMQQDRDEHGSELEDRESCIEKPLPPPKDPKALFMFTHEDNLGREQSEDRWRIMPRPKKERYRAALKSLQRTYMEKYRLYLTSLSDVQLAQHMQEKNIDRFTPAND